jgi:hypothetical protein
MLAMCVSNNSKTSLLHNSIADSPHTSSISVPHYTTPPPKRYKHHHPPKYSPRELGKLALNFAQELHWLGWNKFFRQHYSHTYPSLRPNIRHLPHPAAPFLSRLASVGVPAPSQRTPWTTAQQDAAVTRGPHPSARHQYTDFLLDDMYTYVTSGYWLVLPYSALRGHPHLKIAPSSVIPQRERRPRLIMDYTYNQVNPTSLPLAPTQAMQFGTALQRILQKIAYCNPTFAPPTYGQDRFSRWLLSHPSEPHGSFRISGSPPQ